MNHITSLDEPYPSPTSLASATTSHKQGNFIISSRKLPISKSGPIDAMSARLGIPVPEMIFGDNLVSITHAPSGWSIRFAAEDALDCVDKTDRKMLQVAYARKWSSSREKTSAGIKEVVRPFDWSYSSDYAGTEEEGVGAGGEEEEPEEEDQRVEEETGDSRQARKTTKKVLQPTETPIPLELLKRRDPILFHDEVTLYESELDDNGVSVMSAKLRVMPERMLLLVRLYMRLDNVLLRVRDTRVYVDFATDEVLREYTEREETFETVKSKLRMSGMLPDAVTIAMRDANQVVNHLPLVNGKMEGVKLS